MSQKELDHSRIVIPQRASEGTYAGTICRCKMIDCKKWKIALDSKTPGLEGKCFHCGSSMQKSQIEVDRSLIDHTGRKNGQSAKASLVAVVLTVTEVYQDALPKFKTQKEKDGNVAELEL